MKFGYLNCFYHIRIRGVSFVAGVLMTTVMSFDLFAGSVVSKTDYSSIATANSSKADDQAHDKPRIVGEGLAPSDLCKGLIAMGNKYENANELARAMDCYKAAAAIDAERARGEIVALEMKIKDDAERKKQDDVIQALKRGAAQGNAADAYKLGKIYFANGEIDKAIQMWALASEKKHPKAPYRLAILYEKGEFVKVDLALAEKFYRIGAANGHAECAYITAKLLEMDASNSPDPKKTLDEAFKLKVEAANRGHAVASAEVGYAYSSQGEHLKAKQYFERAQKNASPNSTMTVSLHNIMAYNIGAEDVKMSAQ
ncbi:MAG: hypothetical protein LBR89_00455 [Holosporales bacterium]|jgi:TPR repeat protein|nr:hypothetical protein [Holosporales bacterium]